MKYVLFYCDVEWDIFNRREFILEFAEQHKQVKVVAINRPAAIIPNVFRSGKRNNVLGALNGVECYLDKRVLVVRPVTLFHDHIGGRILQGRGNYLQKVWVEWALRRAGVVPSDADELFIWLYEQPHWMMSRLYSRMGCSRKIIWEIFDDYRMTAQGQIRKMWVDCEKQMVRCSDQIFTLTKSLKEKYENTDKPVDVMGNGFCSRLFSPKSSVPEDLLQVSKPCVMYLGTIRDWIDFLLVERLVKSNRDLHFVFVGPVVENVKLKIENLSKEENFFYLGKKARGEVSYYMSYADLAIIPYIRTEFTRSVKPIKVFEFLACGTPVLTTMSADLESVRGGVYISDDKDFDLKMREALREKNIGVCKELSKSWTWESVVKNVSDKVGV